MEYKTSDTRISDRMEVLTASKLIADQPISDSSAELVYKSRESISKILAKNLFGIPMGSNLLIKFVGRRNCRLWRPIKQ